MTSARIFLIGGLIAYRALFNWLRPAIYIPTMLGGPLFQILFFTYLGRYAGVADDRFFVVGNAVQSCGMACIYGMTMTIANEREFSTLSPLLATPARRFPLFLGRALPLVLNGLLVSTFGLVVGRVLLDVDLGAGRVPSLAVVVVVTVASCTALGMLLGSIGLRARDVFLGSNIVYFLTLLLCGVNIPRDTLPRWLEAVGEALPLTHGIAAAREVAGGATLGDVADLVGREAVTGVLYAAAAYGLFRLFETLGRHSGSLDAQ